MIGELSEGFRTRRTIIWNFFKKLDETFAECNYCHGLYNYGTTKSHLHKHVRRKHPDAILQLKKGKILPPGPPTDEESRTLSPGVEADESQTGGKDVDVWSLFTKIDGTIAKCNLCEVELSCKYSITDLTKHWKIEHLGVLLKCDPSENEPTGNGLCDIPAVENCSSTPQNSQVSSSNAKAPAEKTQTKLRRSPGWKYFTKVDKTFAECKICYLHISHLSTSNLMRHVVRKHPCELMARARNGKQRDAEEDDDLEPQVSDVEAEDKRIDPDSYVWQVFTKLKNYFYKCKICGATIFQRSNVSNLLRHIKRTHPSFVSAMQKVKTESEDVSTKENLQSSQDQEDNVTAEDKRIDPDSYVWQVFTKLKNYFYRCKICGATIFQRSNMDSLLGHIKRTHPSFVSAMEKKLAESMMAAGNCSSGPAEGLDEEGTEPPTAGDSDSAPSDEPESRERNQANEVGGAKERKGKRKRAEAGGRENRCLLSERFASAVEEGNRLMQGLQEVVERQGRALDRIAACLEGMTKNDA